MARATIGKEIHCIAQDETGLRGRVAVSLAQQNIFIQHLLAYTVGDTGHLQLIVKQEDLEKTRKSVAHFISKTEERHVLIVEFENKVGTLAEVAKVLGQNDISIRSVYGTS